MSWTDLLKVKEEVEPEIEEEPEENLGPITEYHGTLDLERVLIGGIRGSSPKRRSRIHVPKELRDAKKITYTTESYEEALAFAKRRAKQLGIHEDNIGVVGVKGKTLEEPIEHRDIRIKAITYVREGGIPRKYLEEVAQKHEES